MGDETAKRDSGRLPVLLAVVAIAALLTAYWLYVRDQEANFSSRDLRLLATTARQLDETLTTHQGFVRNYVRSHRADEEGAAAYLPGFDSWERSCTDDAKTVEAIRRSGDSFEGKVEERNGVSWLKITHQALVPKSAGATPPWSASPKPPPTPQPAELIDQVCTGSARIAFDNILEPVFGQRLLGIFDDVLLARADGNVIYTFHQIRNGEIQRTRDKASPELILTSLTSLEERSGWRSEKKALAPEQLRAATRQSQVTASGRDFILFSQPYPHAVLNADGKSEPWIVAGLVSKRRFMLEAWSISLSVLLGVFALLTLAICAWPYLRVSLMGPHQALTIADVLLLGACALAMASILTLLLLDATAYDSLRNTTDQQLKVLASRLESDFEADIRHSYAALEAVEEWSKQTSWPAPVIDDMTSVAGFLEPAAVKRYPYISLVAWMDGDGQQQFKATRGRASPLVRVANRRYFRDIVEGKPLRLQMSDGRRVELAVESIRSSTTGQTEAVLSKATGNASLPVVAVTAQLLHVTNPVLPPGFGFAIVDEAGNVVFHSEAQRNNQENFFAETDYDRDIRSAAYARHEAFDSVSYWGSDHRVHVRPMRNLPWTLIMFRHKSLLRTVNVETVAMTLFFLLANSLLYLIVLVVLLLRNPCYRAPSLWPSDRKANHYRRLSAVLILSMAAAWVCFYAFAPRAVLLVAFLHPAQAFTAVLLLLGGRRGWLWRVTVTIWILLTLLWAIVVAIAEPMAGTRLQEWVWLLKMIAALLLVVAARLTLAPVAQMRQRDPRLTQRRYSLMATLLLVTAAVVPTGGFFKVANRLELEGLIKYTQLVIAGRAEAAINTIEAVNLTARTAERYAVGWDGDPFQTRWHLWPRPSGARGAGEPRAERCTVDAPWLPALFQNVLPAYSEESISMRQLHSSYGAEANSWRWCRDGNRLTLQKPIALDRAAGGDPGAEQKVFTYPQHARQWIEVQSHLPLTFAGVMDLSDGSFDRCVSFAVRLCVFLLLAAAAITILVWIVRFIARTLFLLDLREPLWLRPPPPLKPALGDHVFLVHRTKSVDELTKAPDGSAEDFHDVQFARLAIARAWREEIWAIDHLASGRNVRCVDFEQALASEEVASKILEFIERLLQLPARTVIVCSTVTPPAFLATLTSPELRARWSALLPSFVWVSEEQLELEERELAFADETNGFVASDDAAWLRRETRGSSFLQHLAREIGTGDADRQQLIDELRERSESYYAALWTSCSPTERLLLRQLAEHGLLNGKDRRIVRRLLARGLVRRKPELALLNETFRLFVLSRPNEEHRHAVDEPPSAWDNIRLPLFVVLLAIVLLIFTTQKDMLNLATGLIAALTTGLPAIVKLFGVFTEKRAGNESR